jgi:glycine/D-amino acid oxidase-like deaminating enzyme/nitrite reductase/ring-hydroxylating ferredoxin subunit
MIMNSPVRAFSARHPAPLGLNPLEENIETDVVIIGGGIAGLSIAYALSRRGRRCVVIEQDLIGGIEPARLESAHLAEALDGRYFRLENIYGTENAALVARSHSAAIQAIRDTIRDENIECHFQTLDGYLSLHPSDRIKTLRQEFEATRRAGLPTELVSHAPGIRLRERISLRFPAQAQFNARSYALGLSRAVLRHGGKIYTGTRAIDVDTSGATTTGGRVTANHIVVATSSPLNTVRIHVKQLAYRSYVIGLLVEKGRIPGALWWDTGDQHSVWSTTPYHYARIQPFDDTYDMLICGGEDHHVANPKDDERSKEEDHFNHLEAWAYDHFPAAEKVVHRSSHLRMEPIDSLGYIGRNPGDSNLYIAAGDAGTGLTYAAIAGLLIPDLIMGKRNPWEDLYNPSRTPVQVLGEFLGESRDTSYGFRDLRISGEDAAEHALSNDEGAVIRIHGRRIAVYRDDQGELHAHLASCPHVGCGLRWDPRARSFECPCHAGATRIHDGKRPDARLRRPHNRKRRDAHPI